MEVIIMKHLDQNQDLKMLSQGNTAEIYAYGEDKILKLFRESMPIEPIEKEYRISRAIQSQLDNVPKAYEFVMYKERYGIIYEKIVGTDFIAQMIKNVFKIKKYAKYMALVHIKMHTTRIDVGYSLTDKLKMDLDGVNLLTGNEKHKILRYIESFPKEDRLLHFDFHPGNLMIRDNSVMIIDWMTACTGDPCADVARTKLLLNFGEMQHVNAAVGMFIRVFERYIGGVYLREYCRLSGFAARDIDKWLLPVAAARLTEWLTDHEKERLVEFVRDKLESLGS